MGVRIATDMKEMQSIGFMLVLIIIFLTSKSYGLYGTFFKVKKKKTQVKHGYFSTNLVKLNKKRPFFNELNKFESNIF